MSPTPGSTYVKLSVQAPAVANKGHFLFGQAAAIDTGQNWAKWALPAQVEGATETIGLLCVWLKSAAAGRRYLFDCSVSATHTPSVPFVLEGPNGDEQTFAVNPQGQHLLFVLETFDDEWYPFFISRKKPWWAYSCEVTNL